MRILFDTNIIIDAAVPARRYHDVALHLIGHVETGDVVGLVAPTSIATCWYVATVRHDVDPRPLSETIEEMFELALMNRRALRAALDSSSRDFEDAYLAASGEDAGADIVVTRNESDFADGPLRPLHPENLVAILNDASGEPDS